MKTLLFLLLIFYSINLYSQDASKKDTIRGVLLFSNVMFNMNTGEAKSNLGTIVCWKIGDEYYSMERIRGKRYFIKYSWGEESIIWQFKELKNQDDLKYVNEIKELKNK